MKITNSHRELWPHIWVRRIIPHHEMKWELCCEGKFNPSSGCLVLTCYRQKEYIFHWKHESHLKCISCYHNLCVVSSALIWPPFCLYTQETFYHYFVLLANVCWSIWFRFFYIISMQSVNKNAILNITARLFSVKILLQKWECNINSQLIGMSSIAQFLY